MLAVQVEYWKLQETNRHNLIAEEQGWASINETKRHNLVTESQGWYGAETERMKADESHRHNVAQENLEQQKIAVSNASLAESARHNRETEAISWGTLSETSKHNRAQEGIGWAQVAEAVRHNKEQEDIQWRNSNTDAYEAETRRMNTENQQQYWDRMASVSEQNVINQFVGTMTNQTQARTSEERMQTDYERYLMEQQRLDHDIAYDWANFAEGTAKDASRETREWLDFWGLSKKKTGGR